ncbi:divergent polysaccharide deacetylase family protein [Marinobacterium rhizophilum]|uniref:Divergent polysaccharide deacetylase family protein n=1 Tax=Marinobacterium rhizophilum TaxID=420402 RepID=A0ABY5HJ24_9GAMM|nr:divergent polysaccharide deacetylase family protein [Marinobacterium rhizophilum]UTW11255.1 divergent polysaccharide deacetylase family protein [Marinobacterium rhizophilum]
MRRRRLLASLAALSGAAALPALPALARGAGAGSIEQPRLLLVIDDVGHSLSAGRNTLALPGPIDCAILPHSTHGSTLAREAHALGKGVMLHAPMANSQQLALGPGALTPDLSRAELQRVLRADLDAIPHVVGVNNHMGSLLTSSRQPMEWVMEVLLERGLWFVDSRTTADTLAWQVARERGVPALMRDVFLDHEQTPEFVHRQFRRGLQIAREYGSALLIGHPHRVTLDYLHAALPLLDELGIQRLTVSAFLGQQADFARLDADDRRLIKVHRRHWGTG